jgi:hypothetical protein
MKWTRRKTKWLVAFLLWLSVMPIHLWDIPVRGGGTQPFYVWNFYNYIHAFIREPIRCITEITSLLAIAVYAMPSIIHVSLAIVLAYLIMKLVKKKEPTEPSAAPLPSEGAPSEGR